MLAEVLHFYGLGWNELLDLELAWFCILYKQIDVVEARRLLAWLPVITYPHLLTRKDRESISKHLTRTAGHTPARLRDTRPETVQAGWDKLAGLGAPPRAPKDAHKKD